MTLGWTCPVCRAVGTIEVEDSATTTTLALLFGVAHSIIQPSCRGTPRVVAPTKAPTTAPKQKATKATKATKKPKARRR